MVDTDSRPPLSVQEALTIVSRFLPLEWSNLTDDQVNVQSIIGGYVNTVNLVTRSTQSLLEPNQVVIHKSGGGYQAERGRGKLFATRFEELLVFYEASKMGTAPKLYGMSEELTVQEYVLSHTLTPEDCLDKNILTKLAQAYAKFHSINVPIDRRKFVENIPLLRERCKNFVHSREKIKELLVNARPELKWDDICALDFESEFDWILKMIDRISFRRVFITGDPNYANVLVADGGNRIAIVDYEMTKCEPRGLELGGHLVNRTLNWKNKVKKPNGHDILDKQLRHFFITEYCKELAHHLTDFDADGLDSVDHVMEEADIGILTYALTWGGPLLFGAERMRTFENGSFFTAAHRLIELYIELKSEMIQVYPLWSE